MGQNAFKLLYKEIKEKKKNSDFTFKELILETDLILRDSTRN